MSMEEDMGHLKADVATIREVQGEMLNELKRTNGRIGTLERWRSYLLGAGLMLSLVLTPVILMEIQRMIETAQGG